MAQRQPPDTPSKPEPSREERLAKALRENLRRRKAPPPPPPEPDEDRR
jgi:hypothetical protein